MQVTIDTSLIIDYLRRSKDASKSPFVRIRDKTSMTVSLVTVAELYAGKSAQAGGIQRHLLDELLTGVDIVTPTLETAKTVGRLRWEHQLSLGDAFVAALALELDVPVVALDRKAFTRVKSLRLYPL